MFILVDVLNISPTETGSSTINYNKDFKRSILNIYGISQLLKLIVCNKPVYFAHFCNFAYFSSNSRKIIVVSKVHDNKILRKYDIVQLNYDIFTVAGYLQFNKFRFF